MSYVNLPFEEALIPLYEKLRMLQDKSEKIEENEEIGKLRKEIAKKKQQIFKGLTLEEKMSLTTHPSRPDADDLCGVLFDRIKVFYSEEGCSAGIASREERRFFVVAMSDVPTERALEKISSFLPVAGRYKLPYVLIAARKKTKGIKINEENICDSQKAYMVARRLTQLKSPSLAIISGLISTLNERALCFCDTLIKLEHALVLLGEEKIQEDIFDALANRTQIVDEGMGLHHHLDDVVETLLELIKATKNEKAQEFVELRMARYLEESEDELYGDGF